MYRADDEFRKLALSTRRGYEYGFRIAQDSIGRCELANFNKNVFRNFLSGFADRPATQKYVRSGFVALETWALERDYLVHPMTYLVRVKGGDGAREPWTDEQIDLAVRHARPELARAITLARWTGQRAGDLIAMQWQHVCRDDDGFPRIELKQQKTGLELWVPILPELEAELDRWDRSLGFILTKANGAPWTRQQLSSAWNYERDHSAALEPLRPKKLSFHGLRASAVIRLRRAGWTDSEVGGFVGMSEKMVSRYARRSVKWQNVRAAMKRTGMEQNNVVALQKPLTK